MSSTAKLYSPEVLGLATSLARWPFDEELPLIGHARAPSCGSTLDLGLRLDATGRIAAIGLRSRACAIGQASAAIFADAAKGLTQAEVARAGEAIRLWLAGDAPQPDWPGLAAIAPAREYPARHGAILLGWRAAAEAR